MLRIILSLVIISITLTANSQNVTISGTVEDKSSGELMISANVYEGKSLEGVITNVYGFYSLTLPKGPVQLICSYVGYQTFTIEFNLSKDTTLNIKLDPTINLDEVVISAERSRSAVQSTQMSVTELSSKTIKSLPVLLGEVDVLKALQLLPGVQSGNEGTSGIYVRGGGPDQNLILLDGVPVYNANHLFGFFSVFNPDAIQNVKLIKGGFPAQYGGRLSSVIDIRMKEGNNKKFAAEGSIGIISSKLTLEGPIWKDKTSFIVSGRRTYIDALAQPLIAWQGRQNGMENFRAGYYFYDLNAKINHRFSDRSRLYLSAYTGEDKAYLGTKERNKTYYYEDEAGLGWGNFTSALRWNYVITPKLFSNTTITYSNYDFITSLLDLQKENDVLQHRYEFAYDSGIRDIAGKIDFDYMPNPHHTIKFGYNHIYHTFKPGVTVFQVEEGNEGSPIDTTFGNQDIYAQEWALFAEDDWAIGTRLKINAGAHFSGFMVNDSTYTSLQPRISARFMINEKISVKAAYSHMAQYIHLLSNTSIGLPTDLWLPVTDRIKPQKSIQYAAGFVYEPNDDWEISIEGYYKTLDNLIEYKEGASFFSINSDWQDKVETGRGLSYGVEFLARKQFGNTTGWVGYTLSKSERQFENISFGEWFPYRYDRRHDLSIVLSHKINDKLDIGVTWVYGTGNAVTLAIEKYASIQSFWYGYYLFNGIEYFEKRNSYRMPAYHRLDIGLNYKRETKWGEGTWSFGAYNVYNRKNPFYLTFDTEWTDSGSQTVLKQYSLFPIIPSISYSFKIK